MATRIQFSTKWPERMGEKAGKPTYFPEKIIKGIDPNAKDIGVDRLIIDAAWEGYGFDLSKYKDFYPKTTTIRKNYDYWKSKEGQMIQPFFWAGKPRRRGSKHVVFCPEVRLKRVWGVKIDSGDGYVCTTNEMGDVNATFSPSDNSIDKLVQFEGFDSVEDFFMWFDGDFGGAYLEFGS